MRECNFLRLNAKFLVETNLSERKHFFWEHKTFIREYRFFWSEFEFFGERKTFACEQIFGSECFLREQVFPLQENTFL